MLVTWQLWTVRKPSIFYFIEIVMAGPQSNNLSGDAMGLAAELINSCSEYLEPHLIANIVNDNGVLDSHINIPIRHKMSWIFKGLL